MTSKTSSTAKFPGSELLDGYLQVHTAVVRRHIDTVNEVWSELTSSEASAASWAQGYGKLLQAWTENSKDLLAFYTGKFQSTATASVGTPQLVFVVDHVAQSAGASQPIPVPADFDSSKLTITRLQAFGGTQHLDDQPAPGVQYVSWLSGSAGMIKVIIGSLDRALPARKSGDYLSIIYYQASSATPRHALATVLLRFVP
jgi:hypothetical protein